MKKLLVTASTFLLLATAPVFADSLTLAIGEPAPVYPVPVYQEPVYGYYTSPWPSEYYDVHRDHHYNGGRYWHRDHDERWHDEHRR